MGQQSGHYRVLARVIRKYFGEKRGTKLLASTTITGHDQEESYENSKHEWELSECIPMSVARL